MPHAQQLSSVFIRLTVQKRCHYNLMKQHIAGSSTCKYRVLMHKQQPLNKSQFTNVQKSEDIQDLLLFHIKTERVILMVKYCALERQVFNLSCGKYVNVVDATGACVQEIYTVAL